MAIMSMCENIYEECFTNIPVIPFLEKIVEDSNVIYEEDFNYDKFLFAKAAKSNIPEEKVFFWMCRNSGTYCGKEYDVFIRNTVANRNCVNYEERINDSAVACIVEIKGIINGSVIGSIYKVNCAAYAKEVAHYAQPATLVLLPNGRNKTATPADPQLHAKLLQFHKNCRMQMLGRAG